MRAMCVRASAFSADAAESLVLEQGYDELEFFQDLARKPREIEGVCRALRRPGGVLHINGVDVPNRGVMISARAEKQLQNLCFLILHLFNTSRPTLPGAITRAMVDAIAALREWEAAHLPPDAPKPSEIFDPKGDWVKTFENMTEYLRGVLGVSGCGPSDPWMAYCC